MLANSHHSRPLEIEPTWIGASGKSGYTPTLDGEKHPLPLPDAVIKTHLLGIQLVGIYPLLSDSATE